MRRVSYGKVLQQIWNENSMNKPENVLIVMRKQNGYCKPDSNISINGNSKEDQNIKKTNGEQEVKKESKKKTIVVITIVIVVLLIGIGVGIGVFMVHNEKTQMFLTMVRIQETQSTAGTRDNNPNEENEEAGVWQRNYEVSEFDAEAYFRENTTF